eukprot:scaffold78124_cov48-Cyclotella_meneghiniana.AAC.4
MTDETVSPFVSTSLTKSLHHGSLHFTPFNLPPIPLSSSCRCTHNILPPIIIQRSTKFGTITDITFQQNTIEFLPTNGFILAYLDIGQGT